MTPRISPMLWKIFGRYAEWYVPRHFHSVRLLHGNPPSCPPDQPLIIYLNHPSWWDPLIGILLIRRFFPNRKHYAPIDAAALNRYRFFSRLGFFGVEQNSPRSGASFLRTAKEILKTPNVMLSITAQGQFTDVRDRPIRLQPGLGHLLRHVDSATILPLALEYPFWNDRAPEALAALGSPIQTKSTSHTATEWTSLLEQRLQEAVNRLSTASIARDPCEFETLHSGKTGVSFFYDLWQKLCGKP